MYVPPLVLTNALLTMTVCARVGGVPTLTAIELYTQHAYFAFQVVQVFLITTLTSAASAAVTKLLEDPSTAKDLLSQNLPKASNFYLSYFLVQSLALGANGLVQWSNLFHFHVLQKFAKNPRKTYLRWHRLQRIHWGTVFPVYTNLGVIGMPAVLFAALTTLIFFPSTELCAHRPSRSRIRRSWCRLSTPGLSI
jgi:calcium permeable stress-gated cation channel